MGKIKLFEIPVYAMSKAELSKRVEVAQKKMRENYPWYSSTEEQINQVIAMATSPQCLWEYNHIIGYIQISKSGADINLDWYTSVPAIQKYYWASGKKKFLQDTQLGGYHFYTGNMKTGGQVRDRLVDLLGGFEKELLKRGYYVDRETFDNVDSMLDYSKLIRG